MGCGVPETLKDAQHMAEEVHARPRIGQWPWGLQEELGTAPMQSYEGTRGFCRYQWFSWPVLKLTLPRSLRETVISNRRKYC